VFSFRVCDPDRLPTATPAGDLAVPTGHARNDTGWGKNTSGVHPSRHERALATTRTYQHASCVLRTAPARTAACTPRRAYCGGHASPPYSGGGHASPRVLRRPRLAARTAAATPRRPYCGGGLFGPPRPGSRAVIPAPRLQPGQMLTGSDVRLSQSAIRALLTHGHAHPGGENGPIPVPTFPGWTSGLCRVAYDRRVSRIGPVREGWIDSHARSGIRGLELLSATPIAFMWRASANPQRRLGREAPARIRSAGSGARCRLGRAVPARARGAGSNPQCRLGRAVPARARGAGSGAKRRLESAVPARARGVGSNPQCRLARAASDHARRIASRAPRIRNGPNGT
jgi:hypothetical protein